MADLWTSDPHKGQFGGSPDCGGLSVKLIDVASSNSKDSLGLSLEASPGGISEPLTGTVTFHLHPTFNPAQISVRALDGRATYICYAWGAFTVGVEMQDGRRAELDLAGDMRLPDWFRNS